MNNEADYYQLKGMVSEMTAEQQAEVEKAKSQVLEMIAQSELAAIGITLAMMQLAVKR